MEIGIEVALERDIRGRLVLHRPGQPPIGVRPVRLFPLSFPDGYIALLDHDDKEVLVIRDAGELDLRARQALQDELERAYLLPRIERVLDIQEEFGVLHWHVITDRGERRFDMRGRDEVQTLTPTRFLVRDIDGNRFEVADLHALDRWSQHLLDAHL